MVIIGEVRVEKARRQGKSGAWSGAKPLRSVLSIYAALCGSAPLVEGLGTQIRDLDAVVLDNGDARRFAFGGGLRVGNA